MCVCVSIGLTEHTDRGLARVGLTNVCVCVCVCVLAMQIEESDLVELGLTDKEGAPEAMKNIRQVADRLIQQQREREAQRSADTQGKTAAQ